jgi:hypothetical protein
MNSTPRNERSHIFVTEFTCAESWTSSPGPPAELGPLPYLAFLHADTRAAAVVIDKLDSSSFQREANCFDGPLLKLVTALKPGNGINGHFSCIVAEKHMAQPLPVAANLWAKTHEFASAAPNADGERAQPAQISGQHFSNGAGAAGWSQNDETKPIVRPEAG